MNPCLRRTLMLKKLVLPVFVWVVAAMTGGPSVFAQYSCAHAPCIVASTNGWIVGEIRTFAFGEDSKKQIMNELASKGWLECAGQPLPRAGYKELFNAIGDVWG